jgi:hypothetical protein
MTVLYHTVSRNLVSDCVILSASGSVDKKTVGPTGKLRCNWLFIPLDCRYWVLDPVDNHCCVIYIIVGTAEKKKSSCVFPVVTEKWVRRPRRTDTPTFQNLKYSTPDFVVVADPFQLL